MTPEQMAQKIRQLEEKVTNLESSRESQRLQEVHDFMLSLKNDSTIPYEVDKSFRKRLNSLVQLSVSGKGADTEDQTVQESGSSSYSVMGDPDLFLEISIGGTTYYLPSFT